MPYELNKIIPNLIASNVERSLAFYRDVLGFSVTATVPESAPFVFAFMTRGDLTVFLNAPEAAIAEYPSFKDRPIGGTLTLFFEVAGVRDAYAELESKVKVVMPLEVKWYGMTEFAFEDPDGYLITFAEREGG
jgi:catechol 2,3-dioxygenase-like lactoylglutathione lyase family enzyme